MSIKSSLRRCFSLEEMNRKEIQESSQTRRTFLSRSDVFWLCYVSTMSNTTENEHFSLFSGMIFTPESLFFWVALCNDLHFSFEQSHKSVRAAVDYEISLRLGQNLLFSPLFCRFHVRRRFVGKRRKSEINTKSKVMSCWLREQMANRWVTSIWFRLRNEYNSPCLSLSSLSSKRGKKVENFG
jgi:hypothetical protein